MNCILLHTLLSWFRSLKSSPLLLLNLSLTLCSAAVSFSSSTQPDISLCSADSSAALPPSEGCSYNTICAWNLSRHCGLEMRLLIYRVTFNFILYMHVFLGLDFEATLVIYLIYTPGVKYIATVERRHYLKAHLYGSDYIILNVWDQKFKIA